MIKKHQRFLNVLNAISDGLILLLSYGFADWFWLSVIRKIDDNMASIQSFSDTMFLVVCVIILFIITVQALMQLYRTSRTDRTNHYTRTILLANLLTLLVCGTVLYVFRIVEYSRGVLVCFFCIGPFSLIVKRKLMFGFLRLIRSKGYNLKHILIVGSHPYAEKIMSSLGTNTQLGLHVDRHIRANEDSIKELEDLLRKDSIDLVLLTLNADEYELASSIISACDQAGVAVNLIPFCGNLLPDHPIIESIGNAPSIRLRTIPLDNAWCAFAKRTMDILLSLFLLILLLPLMIVIAILVKQSSPGPVFFRQQRVGRNKKNFEMLKFRSMAVNADQDSAWSMTHDARRTKIGAFLRKTSLDEVPQLWNVLWGEMSLVGPRPEIPYYVDQFRDEIPFYMAKYKVRPGMTGWAQIHGLRGDTSIPDRTKHDLWYIDHWSLGLDLKILFLTVFHVVNKEE